MLLTQKIVYGNPFKDIVVVLLIRDDKAHLVFTSMDQLTSKTKAWTAVHPWIFFWILICM